jgi:formylglycine-generating enzyme required for sulfatase activity
MSVREFARHLGVSDRMVSKWEADGGPVRPRPVNQAALDTSLATASSDAKARFTARLSGGTAGPTFGDQIVDPATSIAFSVLRHPDDGKLMALVPTGVSPLGEQPKPVWLDGFFIDVYPVTNVDYRRFITSTGHPPPQLWADRPEIPTTADRPVVGVTWHDAAAYALWAGKQLATGPQWEKAARGPAGHSYPWGDFPSDRHSNVRESRIRTTTSVTWYGNGASTYGVYDLCGNVAEWCTTSSSPAAPQVRGGGFNTRAAQAKPTSARARPADGAYNDVGFRCIVSLSAALELLTS